MSHIACFENFYEQVPETLIGDDASQGFDYLCVLVFDTEESFNILQIQKFRLNYQVYLCGQCSQRSFTS